MINRVAPCSDSETEPLELQEVSSKDATAIPNHDHRKKVMQAGKNLNGTIFKKWYFRVKSGTKSLVSRYLDKFAKTDVPKLF